MKVSMPRTRQQGISCQIRETQSWKVARLRACIALSDEGERFFNVALR